MRITDTSGLWWKTAVVYCLDVQTFMDWDDDGMGDFTGLAQRMDYLHDLGITCLWLMPFYPTGDRDDEPPDTSDQVVFPDAENSIWKFNEPTGEWYLHHVYKEQPDLDVTNPKV